MGMTATEGKIYDLLNDGKPHSYAEIKSLLDGEYTEISTIHIYVSRLRKKLPKEQRLKIVPTIFNRRRGYIMVRELKPQ